MKTHCMHVENSDPMIEPPWALNWVKRPYTGIAISPTPTARQEVFGADS